MKIKKILQGAANVAGATVLVAVVGTGIVGGAKSCYTDLKAIAETSRVYNEALLRHATMYRDGWVPTAQKEAFDRDLFEGRDVIVTYGGITKVRYKGGALVPADVLRSWVEEYELEHGLQ